MEKNGKLVRLGYSKEQK